MLWALLFALLFASSSSQSPFLYEDVKKDIKKVVVDEDRLDSLQLILSNHETMMKEMNKDEKEFKKEIKLLFNTQTSEQNDFLLFFKKIKDLKQKNYNQAVESRILFQDLLETKEWDELLAIAEADSSDRKSNYDKLTKVLNKRFQKTYSNLDKHIKNEESKTKITAAVKSYETELMDYIGIKSSHNAYNSDLFVQQESTKQEFLDHYKGISLERDELYRSYASLHETLKQNVSNNDWKKTLKLITVAY